MYIFVYFDELGNCSRLTQSSIDDCPEGYMPLPEELVGVVNQPEYFYMTDGVIYRRTLQEANDFKQQLQQQRLNQIAL